MSKRYLVVVQQGVLILTLAALVTLAVSFFTEKEACPFFFGLFLVALGTSFVLNKFTDLDRRLSVHPLITALLYVLGISVALTASLKDIESKPVYTLSLSNADNVYEAVFRVPDDVPLNKKAHRFDIDVGFMSPGEGDLPFRFNGPAFIYKGVMHIGSCRGTCHSRFIFNNPFYAQPGLYSFTVSLNQNQNPLTRVHSMSVVFREMRGRHNVPVDQNAPCFRP